VIPGGRAAGPVFGDGQRGRGNGGKCGQRQDGAGVPRPWAALQGVVHGVGRLRAGTLSEASCLVPQPTAKYCANSSSSHSFSFRRAAAYDPQTTMPGGPILILCGTNRPNSYALKVARVLERKYGDAGAATELLKLD